MAPVTLSPKATQSASQPMATALMVEAVEQQAHHQADQGRADQPRTARQDGRPARAPRRFRLGHDARS
jgi:hypothetical protein